MKGFLDHRQYAHEAKSFRSLGKITDLPEQPARIDRLQAGAQAAGCEMAKTEDHGLAPIARIHSAQYLLFLRNIYNRWQTDGPGGEVVPRGHPLSRQDSYPESPVGQSGFHQYDASCPIADGTWEAVYWSAQTALCAAQDIIGGARASYGLCRPPGHHAFADAAGGFCYLNNSAIAAEALVVAGMRPAIIDVDVHHGNGTQGIFYDRSDVLTTSLHADPSVFYPFFLGHAHERGEGRGLGSNLNRPLPIGTGCDGYLGAVESCLEFAVCGGCDVIVLALGLDTHESDPFDAFKVRTATYEKMGAMIAAARLPVLIIQEGGYLGPALSDNLEASLRGFSGL